jgi:hypothetical protein
MNNVVSYATASSLPIEAFSVMGMSAKPNSNNPIGEFGTGLKLAVAATIRMGGRFEMWVDGVEYEFYAKQRNFRDTTHEQVMLRKRNSVFKKWYCQELPFTLNYGRNLDWWQIHRELESNTRDEGGVVHVGHDAAQEHKGKGTVITVSHPCIYEAATEGEVFFDPGEATPVWRTDAVEVYDMPSNHMYYRGVRVFTLQYQSRFTYNFRAGHVRLTEDRSPANVWWLNTLIRTGWMTNLAIPKKAVYKALSYNEKKDSATFETHSLEYDPTAPGISSVFVEVARELKKKGFVSERVGAWYGGWSSVQEKKKRQKASKYKQIKLTLEEAEFVHTCLVDAGHSELAKKFLNAKVMEEGEDEE